MWKEVLVSEEFLTHLQEEQQENPTEDELERWDNYLQALENITESIHIFLSSNILTDKEHSTLVRNFYGNMSVGEIAAQDNVSRGAVCLRQTGDYRTDKDGKHGSRFRLGALGKLRQYLIDNNKADLSIIIKSKLDN